MACDDDLFYSEKIFTKRVYINRYIYYGGCICRTISSFSMDCSTMLQRVPFVMAIPSYTVAARRAEVSREGLGMQDTLREILFA